MSANDESDQTPNGDVAAEESLGIVTAFDIVCFQPNYSYAFESRPLKFPALLKSTVVLFAAIATLSFVPDTYGQTTVPAHIAIPTATLEFVQNHCIDCHNADTHEGGLNLASVSLHSIDPTAKSDSNSLESKSTWATWEDVLKRLATRQMPPPDSIRPSEVEYSDQVAKLSQTLNQLANSINDPGRIPTFRRLTRTEYQNAIRDLMHLQVDATTLLPKDEESFGFDNITVTGLTPALIDRYVKAAELISKLAVSASSDEVVSRTVRIPPDQTQAQHVLGLPLGTRGGILIEQFFAIPGEYEVSVRLMRDRNEEIEGMTGDHELQFVLNKKPLDRITIKRPKNASQHLTADQHLTARMKIPAGQQNVGVTFVAKSNSLIETRREPLNVQFNHHRHRRQGPAVYSVSITGPYSASKNVEENSSPTGDRSEARQKLRSQRENTAESLDDFRDREISDQTPSRNAIFGSSDDAMANPQAEASKILNRIMRHAYRRPVKDADLDVPMQFFQNTFSDTSNFEHSIQSALESILVNPNFLLRTQKQPTTAQSGEAYAVDDLELASRLSFFLWSSLPDEQLLQLAEQGQLHQSEVLARQVRRMLKDARSDSLTTNFARQWLYLNNLQSVSPDARLFPDFDQNLRTAMKQETELFFRDMVQTNRSVTVLLKSNFTFLNERLARHYDIPHVRGSRFRRVELEPRFQRGGLLRHGSLLTVTSYATRTSPVLRGNWVLKNILGTPPPPPPENVPDLKENTVDSTLSVRDRLNEHRANPACASCHNLMDPVGFSLESYDAVGRFRPFREGRRIDDSGGLPDGQECHGPADLEDGLLTQSEVFVAAFTEKLMVYGLGRGLTYKDQAAVRKIVAESAASNYRFSDLVLGITLSKPFLMRTAE